MSEDRVVSLLEEIRALQTEHLGLYRTALENQMESVQAQKEAIAYQKLMMRRGILVILPLIAIVVGLSLWLILQF